MEPHHTAAIGTPTDAPPTYQFSEPLTLSVTEAASLLGISRALAYDLVRAGELPAIRLGRRLVVPRRSLTKMLDPKAAG